MTETLLANVGDPGKHKDDPSQEWTNGSSDSDWILEIVGAVENEEEYTLAKLKEMTVSEMELNIKCVSAGTNIYKRKGPARFTGVSLHHILAAAVPKATAKTVVFVSSAPGWTGPTKYRQDTPLELELCQCPGQVLLAWDLDGKPLPYENGGPLRSVVDGAGFDKQRYFYKSLKWLSKIEILEDPIEHCERGTWERFAGYNLHGRLGEQRIAPFVAEIDKEGEPRRPYPKRSPADQALEMQRVLLHTLLGSGDLSNLVGGALEKIDQNLIQHPKWSPQLRLQSEELDQKGKPKRAAALRGTDFRKENFQGWNLSHVNFSLAKFNKAILGSEDAAKAARMVGCDCEGARFVEADLRNVDLSGKAYLAGCLFNRADLRGATLREARLDGANFQHADLSGADLTKSTIREAATVEGLHIYQAKGLSDEDREWLLANGAIDEPRS